jgi:hypothetical protein
VYCAENFFRFPKENPLQDSVQEPIQDIVQERIMYARSTPRRSAWKRSTRRFTSRPVVGQPGRRIGGRGTTSTTRRNATRAKTNRAVRRKLYRPGLSRIVNNRAGIQTLAKQVRSLQLHRHGELQRTVQHVSVHPQAITVGGVVYNHNFSTHSPLLFAANDFNEDSSVLTKIGASPLFKLKGFEKHNFEYNVPGGTPGSIYSYFTGMYDDTVDPEQFMPVSTVITVSCDIQDSLSADETVFRMDLFTVKKVLNFGNNHALQLPNNLAALGQMASRDPSHKNWFNPKFFTRLGTKYMSATPHGNQTSGIRTLSMSMKHVFKPKVLTPHAEGTQNAAGMDFSTDALYDRLPQDQIVWCLISSNRTHTIESLPRFTISRHCTWRDKSGVDN